MASESAANGNGELLWPDSKDVGRDGIEAVLRGWLEPLARMAAYVLREISPEARRAAAVDDLVQEALIAGWREYTRPGEARLRSSHEFTNFMFGVLRNQAAKAASKGRKYVPLAEDHAASQESVLDEVIARRECLLADQAVRALEAMVQRADRVLCRALTRLSPAEATAVDAWLREVSYVEAGKPHGLSLAKMRRAVRTVGSGFLGYHTARIRGELKALYELSPAAAAQVHLGRLERLVLGPRRGRRMRKNINAQILRLVEFQNVKDVNDEHAA